MRYLLRVTHTNEYADHHLYAVLDISPELARCVLERMRRVQALTLADSSLCEVAYYERSADWYDWYDRVDLDDLENRGWLTNDARGDFEADGWCVLSDEAELGDDNSEVNYARMVFCSFGVCWVSRCKYTSDEFSTEALPFDVFKQMAAESAAAMASSSSS